MNCEEVRNRIHDLLDDAPGGRHQEACRAHLQQCPECRKLYEDLLWVGEMLRVESRMSSAMQEQTWQRIQARIPPPFATRLSAWWGNFVAFWRDLDRAIVWSRVVAVPVTCASFALVMLQFSRLPIPEVIYPVFTVFQPSSALLERVVVTPTPARQPELEINGLMNTVWKMPYEDSLSLVAEITPEGYAQIDDVLQYPKDQRLLEAVDLALRRTQFEMSPSASKPFLIYSFQKIDVYGDQRGL